MDSVKSPILALFGFNTNFVRAPGRTLHRR